MPIDENGEVTDMTPEEYQAFKTVQAGEAAIIFTPKDLRLVLPGYNIGEENQDVPTNVLLCGAIYDMISKLTEEEMAGVLEMYTQQIRDDVADLDAEEGI